MMTTAMDELVHQLRLDARGEQLLRRLVDTQRRIDRKLAEIEELQALRHDDVVDLTSPTGPHRVTKYRLAKLLGLSQTTMGNIVKESEPEHASAS